MKLIHKQSCPYCGTEQTLAYMVHDRIWKSAGLKPKEICCHLCLEKKLGRTLTIQDLRPCPLSFGLAILIYKDKIDKEYLDFSWACFEHAYQIHKAKETLCLTGEENVTDL